jgi:hypothetical protein
MVREEEEDDEEEEAEADARRGMLMANTLGVAGIVARKREVESNAGSALEVEDICQSQNTISTSKETTMISTNEKYIITTHIKQT